MAFVPVTRTEHKDKRWRPRSAYTFAASVSIVPLYPAELALAATSAPIALAKRGDELTPVGVYGLGGGNLCVGPRGEWLSGQPPLRLQAHPFRLQAVNGQTSLLLFVDADFVGGAGEPFFADAQLTDRLSKLAEGLRTLESQKAAAAPAGRAILQAGILVPWSSAQADKNDSAKSPDNLYRIDEKALNALSSEAFDALRRAGSLPLIYCQMISMNNINRLKALRDLRAKQKATNVKAEDVFMTQDKSDAMIDWNAIDNNAPKGPA
jgi:hypothetical protein